MKIRLFLLVTLLYLTGCDGSGPQPSPADFPTGLFENQKLEILGEQRNYHLYLTSDTRTAPIVLLLHGNRGSSDQILGESGLVAPNGIWKDIASRENLILIVPDGNVGSEGHQGWNDCRNDAPTNPVTDDVLFISTLVKTVSEKYKTPSSKFYSVGVSNGGMMTMRLADEIPNQLLGIASIVSSRPLNTECMDASVPISALIMNGTADPILPYLGGHIVPMRGELFSTLDAVAYWVNRNQANTAMQVVELEDIEPKR